MIPILFYEDIKNDPIFQRKSYSYGVEDAVKAIIENVRENGDKALFEYTARFDRADLTSLAVSAEEIEAAFAAVDPALIEVMREAADNIRAFHSRQVRNSFVITDKPGVVLGQRVIPLDRVGLYVPGGTASYPSTVLMDAIPAKIAGVPEVVMVTPPAPDGTIAPVILAAAKIAGVDRIFKLGGAQAVAALAHGTESVPRVDKIVGPGNAYVAEAKKQVFGLVDIDMIAGPSEILIVSDGSGDPAHTAADLLSQAEHDRMASAVLVCTDPLFAGAVQAEVESQCAELPRFEIAAESIRNNGKIILVDTIEKAIEISNALAPEHLELSLAAPFDYLPLVKHAGSVFLGNYCPESLGDYFAGPNHTLPTGGTARFSSPLSVDDFVKKSAFSYYSPEALLAVKDKIALFAESEGLHAHAQAALIRFDEERENPWKKLKEDGTV